MALLCSPGDAKQWRVSWEELDEMDVPPWYRVILGQRGSYGCMHAVKQQWASGMGSVYRNAASRVLLVEKRMLPQHQHWGLSCSVIRELATYFALHNCRFTFQQELFVDATTTVLPLGTLSTPLSAVVPAVMMKAARQTLFDAVNVQFSNFRAGLMTQEALQRWCVQVNSQVIHLVTTLWLALKHGHFDLKPSNFVLERTLDPSSIRMVDLGTMCCLRQLQRSPWPLQATTHAYAPPEQLLDTGVRDVSSDVWSLGCILLFVWRGGNPILWQHASKTTKAVDQLFAQVRLTVSSALEGGDVDPDFWTELWPMWCQQVVLATSSPRSYWEDISGAGLYHQVSSTLAAQRTTHAQRNAFTQDRNTFRSSWVQECVGNHKHVRWILSHMLCMDPKARADPQTVRSTFLARSHKLPKVVRQPWKASTRHARKYCSTAMSPCAILDVQRTMDTLLFRGGRAPPTSARSQTHCDDQMLIRGWVRGLIWDAVARSRLRQASVVAVVLAVELMDTCLHRTLGGWQWLAHARDIRWHEGEQVPVHMAAAACLWIAVKWVSNEPHDLSIICQCMALPISHKTNSYVRLWERTVVACVPDLCAIASRCDTVCDTAYNLRDHHPEEAFHNCLFWMKMLMLHRPHVWHSCVVGDSSPLMDDLHSWCLGSREKPWFPLSPHAERQLHVPRAHRPSKRHITIVDPTAHEDQTQQRRERLATYRQQFKTTNGGRPPQGL